MTQETNWVSENDSPYIYVDDDGSRVVAKVFTGGVFLTDREREERDFIAAAPEMLREMEALAQALEDTGHEPPQSFYDVISKARGTK